MNRYLSQHGKCNYSGWLMEQWRWDGGDGLILKRRHQMEKVHLGTQLGHMLKGPKGEAPEEKILDGPHTNSSLDIRTI